MFILTKEPEPFKVIFLFFVFAYFYFVGGMIKD